MQLQTDSPYIPALQRFFKTRERRRAMNRRRVRCVYQRSLPDSSPDPQATAAALEEDIRDIRGPKFVLPAWFVPALLAAMLVLAVLAFAAWRWLRRRRRPRALLPFEVALQRLADIRALLQPQHAREFSIAVSDIIRSYIEQRFDVTATHQTTEEFLRDLLHLSQCGAGAPPWPAVGISPAMRSGQVRGRVVDAREHGVAARERKELRAGNRRNPKTPPSRRRPHDSLPAARMVLAADAAAARHAVARAARAGRGHRIFRCRSGAPGRATQPQPHRGLGLAAADPRRRSDDRGTRPPAKGPEPHRGDRPRNRYRAGTRCLRIHASAGFSHRRPSAESHRCGQASGRPVHRRAPQRSNRSHRLRRRPVPGQSHHARS